MVDNAGNGVLPIGMESFEDIVQSHVRVDKTLPASDLAVQRGVTLFCRPRRFGKPTVHAHAAALLQGGR